MALPKFAFFDGKIVPYSEAKVGLLTHALNYGTGCFAGIRAYWNAKEEELFVFRGNDHFVRFLESTRLLSMEIPFSAEGLVGNLIGLLRRERLREDCYIRPLAFLSDETIGVRLHGLKASLSIVAFPFGKYLDREEGAHLTISSWRRIDDNVIPPRGKISGGYVNSALAKTDAQTAASTTRSCSTHKGRSARRPFPTCSSFGGAKSSLPRRPTASWKASLAERS